MLILAAVLTMFYGGMVMLWEWHPARFSKIDAAMAVEPVDETAALHNPYTHLPLPFFDLFASLAARKCELLGYDVTERDPCDPMDRPANYSPLLQHLPLEWIGEENILAAGAALGFIFLLTLLFVLRPESPWELAVAALGTVSSATFFAVERANLDVLNFVLVVGAVLLPQQYLWARLLSYLAAFVGFLIKFYPITFLVAAIREKFGVCLSLAAASLGGLGIFITIYWRDLRHISAQLPPPRIFRWMFGGEILPRAIQQALGLPSLMQYVLYLLFCAGSLALGLLIARKLSKPVSRLGELHPKLALLLCAGLLIGGCFFAGFSGYYRAIFLLPALPGLFAQMWSVLLGLLPSESWSEGVWRKS